MSDTISTGAHEAPAPGYPIEILIARHPQVVANVEGRFVGSGESPFTELGHAQCPVLADFVAAWGPSRIYSSPRRRAALVAETAGELSGAEILMEDGLAEIDFGAAEGLTYDEAVAAGVAIDLLGGPPESAPFHDGETWRSFAARIQAVADRIGTPEEYAIAGQPNRVAVIAHGGVVRALLAHWLGLPESAAWHFAVPNASVATLTLWDGTGTLRTFGVEPAGDGGAHGAEHHGRVWGKMLERRRRFGVVEGRRKDDH